MAQNDIPSMIVVMGVTGAGKSHFINQLAGKKVVKEGSDLNSCTQECQLVPISIGSSKVLLLDTPGFDDSNRSDSDILTEIAKILAAQYALGVELKGIIYLHRITDVRYSGAAIKTFEIFKKICGDMALSNVLLVTSRWADMSSDPGLGEERERQLKQDFWAYMLGHGSNVSRFHGDQHSAIALVSQLLCRGTVVLQLQKELVDQEKELQDTVAGSYVSDNLESMKKQYQQQLSSLEKLRQELLDSDRAMKRKNQRDLEAERARLRQVHDEQVSLQRAVGSEVQQEIKKKRSGISKVLPFAPSLIAIFAQFAHMPTTITDTLYAWFGGDFDPTAFLF